MSDGNGIIIVKDKKKENIEELKAKIEDWLDPEKTLVISYCRGYRRVTPMILAEKYMEQIDGQVYDYKFFCFGGKPFCVYTVKNHFEEENYPITFYDMDWNKLDVHYDTRDNCDFPKPRHFEEMTKYAKILSEKFPFVRVDFYEVDDTVYVGELTFYPSGGYCCYTPQSFDREMGDLFVLPR